MKITIPKSWWTSVEREKTRNKLGNIVADGIYTQLLRRRALALADNEEFTSTTIQDWLKHSWHTGEVTEWSPFSIIYDLGLVIQDERGFLCVAYENEAFKAPRRSSAASKAEEQGGVAATLEGLYKRYPMREGNMNKAAGMKRAQSLFKTSAELAELGRAVDNMAAMVKSGLISERRFIPMWSTFINNWQAYLPENTKTTNTEELPF